MTTALEGGEGSASRPGRSLPPGKTRYPLYRRLGGPQGRSRQVPKISPPPRFDLRTVQPVASRYTDYATRPTYTSRPVTISNIQEVHQSLHRIWQPLMAPEGWGSKISWQSAHEGCKVVSPTHRPPLLVLISLRGWVDPRAIGQPEGLCQWKIPVASSGIEPETFWLVAQGLRQLRHSVPPNQIYMASFLSPERCSCHGMFRLIKLPWLGHQQKIHPV